MFKFIVIILSAMVLNIATTDTDVGKKLTAKILKTEEKWEEINNEGLEMLEKYKELQNQVSKGYVPDFDEEQRCLEENLASVSAKIDEVLGEIVEKTEEIEEAKNNGDITDYMYDKYDNVVRNLKQKSKTVIGLRSAFDELLESAKETSIKPPSNPQQ